MKNGILVLAHGSRVKTTVDTIEAVVAMMKAKVEDEIMIGYMEFAEPNIDGALTQLKEAGVTDVKIVPYFLFEGIHIQKDIPNEVNEWLEKNEGVNVTFGKTLGVDERLADILLDRVNN